MYNILLGRETNNLIKINKVGKKIAELVSGENIKIMKSSLLAIKTKEHDDKIRLYIDLLTFYERNNNKNSARRDNS